MTSTLSSPPPAAHRHARRKTAASAAAEQARTRQPRVLECRQLGRYTDRHGCRREIVAQRGSAGSVLVVDREVAHGGDRRLVAHLAADEPAANAALECERYLSDARHCRCRPLTAEDLRTTPFPEDWHVEPPPSPATATADGGLLDERGRCYRLKTLSTGMSIPELRWCRRLQAQGARVPEPVSVRAVIAHLQAYEPVRTLTSAALALHHPDAEMSTTVLRAELQRVQASPIVLNRLLRETVLAAIHNQELSLSEIAIRCGRVKRDFRGNESGETSWLARRIGILPEGGRSAPTPWIHSDVLALIARRGLAVSPREVELG